MADKQQKWQKYIKMMIIRKLERREGKFGTNQKHEGLKNESHRNWKAKKKYEPLDTR